MSGKQLDNLQKLLCRTKLQSKHLLLTHVFYILKVPKFFKLIKCFMEAPMDVQEIRKVVRQRPFKPFWFHLDNGQKYAVKHSEIVVGNELIVTLDEYGKTVMIAPEAVTSLEFMEAEFSFAEPTTDKP
jgi:hypothetical protein